MYKHLLSTLIALTLFSQCKEDTLQKPSNPDGINLSWSQTKGPEGGDIIALEWSGETLLAGAYYGIFVSEDRGDTWTQVMSDTYINSLVAKDNRVFAGGSGGVFASNDNGHHWTNVSSDMLVNALLYDGDDILAGTFGGVFRSSDNGATWTKTSEGITDRAVKNLVSNSNSLFAGTEQGGVFRSKDDGASWFPVNNDLPSLNIISLLSNTDHVFAATQDGVLLVSQDDGDTWTQTTMTGLQIRCMAANQNDIYVGTNGGIFHSGDDGKTWKKMNNGLTNIVVESLAAGDTDLYAGTVDGVFHSTDSGVNWHRSNKGLISHAVISLATLGNLTFAGTYGGLYMTNDHGTTWDAVNESPFDQYINALLIVGNTIFEGTDGVSFKSSDKGASWTRILGLENLSISCFVSYENKIIAGTMSGVYVSTDNGESWTPMPSNGLVDMRVMTLVVMGNEIFVGTNTGGVFRSTIDGANWIAANSGLSAPEAGLPTMPVASLIEHDGILFAGTPLGIYKSANKGESWLNVSPNIYVNFLVEHGNDIFAGTFGKGILVSHDHSVWRSVSNGLTDRDVMTMAFGEHEIIAGTVGSGAFISELP